MQSPIFTWFMVRFFFFFRELSKNLLRALIIFDVYLMWKHLHPFYTTWEPRDTQKHHLYSIFLNKPCHYFSFAMANPCWCRAPLQRWVPNENWDKIFSIIPKKFLNSRWDGFHKPFNSYSSLGSTLSAQYFFSLSKLSTSRSCLLGTYSISSLPYLLDCFLEGSTWYREEAWELDVKPSCM